MLVDAPDKYVICDLGYRSQSVDEEHILAIPNSNDPLPLKNSKAWLGVARKTLTPAWPSGRRWTKSSPGASKSTRRASWQFLSLFSINWMLATWYFLTWKQVKCFVAWLQCHRQPHRAVSYITWISESKVYCFSDISPNIVVFYSWITVERGGRIIGDNINNDGGGTCDMQGSLQATHL